MTTPGTPPSSDAEWARDTEQRLRQLEAPNTMRIGPWVISDENGTLIATKPGDRIEFGQLPEDDEVPDVTRGYITNQIGKVVDSIADPNGAGGIPKIKDFLSGKWDDIVQTADIVDARAYSGSNLVTNPGFEKPLFWVGDGELITSVRRTGLRAVRLTATGSLRKAYLIATETGRATIGATAGDLFYAEMWMYGDPSNTQVSGGANGISMFVEVFDKDGNQIGQTLTMTGATAGTSLNGQWTRFYGYIAIPTGSPYNQTASMSAYIGLNSNVTPGERYVFDDPILRVDSIVNSWSILYDGANGTSGSTGIRPIDLFDPLRNIRNKALEGASGASGALNTATAAASGAAAAHGIAQGVVDAIYVGLKNLTGSDFGLDKAEAAMRDVNTSLANLATTTANLQAQRDAGMFYGTAVNEAFSAYDVGSTLGAKWSTVNSGTGSAQWQISESHFYGLNRGAAMIPVAGASSRSSKVRLLSPTATKWQRVGIVFINTGGPVGAGSTAPGNHKTYVYGRVSADFSRYVYFRFESSRIYFGCNTGGGDVDFPGWKDFVYKSGVTYWIEFGTSAAGTRTYRLMENNTAVHTVVDSGAVTPANDTDLYTGFGGFIVSGNYIAATVAGFAVYDNVPPFQRGIGFRASNSRANSPVGTSNFNLDPSPSNDNTGVFPPNWFLTDYITAEMLYDPSTNTLTVAQPGWYSVVICQKGSNEFQGAGGGRVGPCVLVDTGSGTFFPRAAAFEGAHTTGKSSFAGAYDIYLQGGDRVKPGYKSTWSTSGTNSYIGTASGYESFWTVTFKHNAYNKITTI